MSSKLPKNAIRVLDKGFVRLEDFMGGDKAIVRAARVSTGSDARGVVKDRKLIAYLLKHRHTTPFEHAVFTFHVKCPILVMRQWIRHRMSSYNEMSARYRKLPGSFYFPTKWRAQDFKNKQGSVTAKKLNHKALTAALQRECKAAYKAYLAKIKAGVAREMARNGLPFNIYTEFYWTVNANALLHFIGLRSEAHAQWETRQFSHALCVFMRELAPMTWAAANMDDGPLSWGGYSELRKYMKKEKVVRFRVRK